MLKLLGAPPLVTLAIVLAIMAYLLYHIASNGRGEPISVLVLALLAFALVRTIAPPAKRTAERQGQLGARSAGNGEVDHESITL